MRRETFDSRDAAAAAVAQRLHEALVRELAAAPAAHLIVSGGASPAAVYTQLAQLPADWSRVNLLLSDERNVPPEHKDSNSGMVRQTLLTARAATANLLDITKHELPAPGTRYASALLGMGEDGHFASIFPDADNLNELLDPASSQRCSQVHTAASPHPRTSLGLAELLRAREILLLVYGAAKHQVLTAPAGLPIQALLSQQQTPVIVFYAP